MQNKRQVRKKQTIRILIASSDKHAFADLTLFFKKKVKIEISWATSGQNALNIISDHPFDLVIVDDQLSDMAGLGFIKKLVTINPMINSALVSKLSHDEFHEQTEGLGILAQLPKKPNKVQADDLLKKLKRILS